MKERMIQRDDGNSIKSKNSEGDFDAVVKTVKEIGEKKSWDWI